MRLTPPLLALTLTTAASAQSWEFTFSNPILSPANPSTTVTLWASFPPGHWAFAVAELDLSASEAGWAPPSPSSLLLPMPGQLPGELQPGGRRIDSLLIRQLSTPGGFVPDTANPIAVWRGAFEVRDFAPRSVTLATQTDRFAVYPEQFATLPAPLSPIDVEVAIKVIPAPGPIALLGLGALAIARRRSR